MTLIDRGTIPLVIIGSLLVWAPSVHAGWSLTVSGATSDGAQTIQIGKTGLDGTPKSGSSGEMHKALYQQSPNITPVYYASTVTGEVNVGSSSKSESTSTAITGDKEWRWQWVPEEGKNVDDYVWEYSVKGQASAAADVKLDDNSGFGKAESDAWVKIQADSENSSPDSDSVSVTAGAEVRADGDALTGIGWGFGGGSGSASISWENGGSQLFAGHSVTKWVTLSEVLRPGVVCWVKVHTSAGGTMGQYHDTFHYGNDLAADAGIVQSYSLLKLDAPYFLPE